MGNKNTATKTFAEEGLEEISSEAAVAEAAIGTDGVATEQEEEFVQVGGLEPISLYYRTTAPKKPTKNPYKVISKGEVITGRYERSFVSGKFGNSTYIIRLADNTLIGLPGTGSLARAMEKLAEGSKVRITYDGMSTIKGGQWAGSDAHNFTVFGSKLKA